MRYASIEHVQRAVFIKRINRASLSSGLKRVIIAIAQAMTKCRHSLCWKSEETLAKELGLHRQTVVTYCKAIWEAEIFDRRICDRAEAVRLARAKYDYHIDLGRLTNKLNLVMPNLRGNQDTWAECKPTFKRYPDGHPIWQIGEGEYDETILTKLSQELNSILAKNRRGSSAKAMNERIRDSSADSSTGTTRVLSSTETLPADSLAVQPAASQTDLTEKSVKQISLPHSQLLTVDERSESSGSPVSQKQITESERNSEYRVSVPAKHCVLTRDNITQDYRGLINTLTEKDIHFTQEDLEDFEVQLAQYLQQKETLTHNFKRDAFPLHRRTFKSISQPQDTFQHSTARESQEEKQDNPAFRITYLDDQQTRDRRELDNLLSQLGVGQ